MVGEAGAEPALALERGSRSRLEAVPCLALRRCERQPRGQIGAPPGVAGQLIEA
jgi:hypothetical protein